MAEDPREALAREARELRERREAKTQDQNELRTAHEEARKAKMRSVSTWRMAMSVARPWTAFALGVGVIFAVMFFMMPADDERIVIEVALLICMASGLWFITGLPRWKLFRARLPFRVDGDEVLGLGAAVKTADVTVKFRDTVAPIEMLAELLHARLPETTTSAGGTGMLLIHSPELETESSNWRLAGWFRRLARRVLVDVHEAYAIEWIALSSNTTTEFYIGSGD